MPVPIPAVRLLVLDRLAPALVRAVALPVGAVDGAPVTDSVHMVVALDVVVVLVQ
jgi:hypothetical protein